MTDLINIDRRDHLIQIMVDFLNTLNLEYIQNESTVVPNYTLDFFIPSRNVAVDVCDFLTHNNTFHPTGKPPAKKHFLLKSNACTNQGIRIIYAWEHCLDPQVNCKFGSWLVLQNTIKSACGIYDRKIYARKTKVVEFPAIDTKPFFMANNINGYRTATTTYALVDKNIENPTVNDILMGYSVGHAYFGKGLYDAEIARGACVLGTQVAGGASKLWKYITENTTYKNIIYYVDSNYFNGKSIAFLPNTRFIKEDVSFWNWHLDTQALKNREPNIHSQIMQKKRDGLLWEVCNAGTQVNVWERPIDEPVE